MAETYLFEKVGDKKGHPSPHISKFLTFGREKSSKTNDLFDQ